MNKIILWLFLLIKRQLKSKAFTLFLIAIPLCIFIITHIPKALDTSVPRIGIVLLDTDEISVKAAETLIQNSSVLGFYLCNSTEELYDNIKSGDTECGYVFPKDFTRKLDTRTYSETITVISNSSNFVSSISNEVVFSAIFREYGKNIAMNYVNTTSIFSSMKADALKMTAEKYDKYIDGAATFHINYNTLSNDGETENLNDIKSTNYVFPIRGILAILIFIAGLFGCVQWLKDSENGIFAPMSYSFQHISRLLYTMIPTCLFMISSLLTIYLARLQTSFFIELRSMLYYFFLIVVVNTLLTYIIKKSRILVSIIPVLIIGSLIFCPIFINLENYLPLTNIMNKLFLPYYYLMWVS